MQNESTLTGIVLAGGRGSRMGGEDKGLIRLQDNPLFIYVLRALKQQTDRVVISANRNIEIYQQQDLPVVQDTLPGYLGPLAGMQAVMSTIKSEWYLFCPCDTPYIPDDLAHHFFEEQSKSHSKALWINDGERDHPTISLIHHSLACSLKAYLLSGERRVMQFLRSEKGHSVVYPHQKRYFQNINTPEDLLIKDKK